MGAYFSGSSQIETTETENEEIIFNNEYFYKFSFMNPNQDCTVMINDSEPIFFQAGIGFSTDQIDARIYSFKIVEEGTDYYWMGGRA